MADRQMTRKHALWALGVHAGLLLLASTKFTVVSWIWGSRAWTWSYFQYSYRNGWGHRYQSDYSLGVVLAYAAAYLVGVVGYALAQKIKPNGWNALARILCVLGLASFVVEGSHWLLNHHLSLILTCSAASLILAVITMVQLCNWEQPSTEQPNAPDESPSHASG